MELWNSETLEQTDRRSTNGENGAVIRVRGDIVHSRGKVNLTLIDGHRGQERESVRGPVMHQVGPDVRWKMLEVGTTQEKNKPDDQQEGEQASLTSRRKEACHQTGAGWR